MQPDFSRDARIAPILTRIAQLPKKPRLLVTCLLYTSDAADE